MQVTTDERLPIMNWADNLEHSAMDQLRNLAKHPVAYHHIAAMPDAHFGMGMPIGGVIACENAVIPSAVGVDIGCGMGWIRWNIKTIDLAAVQTGSGPLLKAICGNIVRNIPTGKRHHKEPQEWAGIASYDRRMMDDIEQLPEDILRQLGTLGGGNHFIELQADQNGFLCLMVHSGSRNLGKRTADYYVKAAKKMNEQWHSECPPHLNFLPVSSAFGKRYLQAMNFCLDFAQENRRLMLIRAENVILNMVKKYTKIDNIIKMDTVNAHHNYAALEHHYGKDVWVHRKGAIRAREGDVGIIPGSMGTASYIVEGLNNPQSFHSASHGAGRTMSRTKARETLSVETEKERMKDVVMMSKVSKVIDECPGAYKDIDAVIEAEKDLVRKLHTLKPIASIKGD